MNKRLVDAFGSVRRKRQLLQKEAGQVKVDAIGSAEALKVALKEAGAKQQAEGFTKAHLEAKAKAARNLPPHHLEAAEPDSAYRAEEVMGPAEVYGNLGVSRVLRCQEDPNACDKAREGRELHPYVLDRLPSLRLPEEGAGEAAVRLRKHRARCLAFLSYLLSLPKVLGSTKGGASRLAAELQIPEPVMEHLLAKFYVVSDEGKGEKYIRPKEQTELLYAYILVTALMAEQWR